MEKDGRPPDSCSSNVFIWGFLQHKDPRAVQLTSEMKSQGFLADVQTTKLVVDYDQATCCYQFLGSHTKMRKYKYIYSEEIQKNNRSEKRMLECRKIAKNWLRRFKNTKSWNLTIYRWLVRALLTSKIQFEEEKFEVRCLWIQLNFI